MDSDPDFDDEPLEEHPAIMRRIDAVRFLHERHTALCDELAGKVEALQLEYDAKLAPILARRAEIVSGRSEPTPDEAKPLEHYLASFAPTTDEPEPGIPGFWLTAITEHEALRDAVTEADAPILEYLQDVQCIKFGPGERERARAPGGRAGRAGDAPDASDDVGELPGFELVFAFAPNPYFDERELRKVVWLEDGYPAATQGCAISWRAGKDVTHRVRASAARCMPSPPSARAYPRPQRHAPPLPFALSTPGCPAPRHAVERPCAGARTRQRMRHCPPTPVRCPLFSEFFPILGFFFCGALVRCPLPTGPERQLSIPSRAALPRPVGCGQALEAAEPQGEGARGRAVLLPLLRVARVRL